MPEQEQITQLEKRIRELETVLFSLVTFNRIVLEKDIDIISSAGLRIGTKTAQKLSFYGVTPVIQGAAISSPSGGATVDAEARTAINTIRTRLTSIGITA